MPSTILRSRHKRQAGEPNLVLRRPLAKNRRISCHVARVAENRVVASQEETVEKAANARVGLNLVGNERSLAAVVGHTTRSRLQAEIVANRRNDRIGGDPTIPDPGRHQGKGDQIAGDLTILDRRLGSVRGQGYAPAAADLTTPGRQRVQNRDPFRLVIKRNLAAGTAWAEANLMEGDCDRVIVVANRVEEAGTEVVLCRYPPVIDQK